MGRLFPDNRTGRHRLRQRNARLGLAAFGGLVIVKRTRRCLDSLTNGRSDNLVYRFRDRMVWRNLSQRRGDGNLIDRRSI